MDNTRPLWLRFQFASLAHGQFMHAETVCMALEFMRTWLQEVDDNSAAEGYHACMIGVAIDSLDDEIAAARERVTTLAVESHRHALMTEKAPRRCPRG